MSREPGGYLRGYIKNPLGMIKISSVGTVRQSCVFAAPSWTGMNKEEVRTVTLEEMKSVDPRTVDRKTLVERKDVHIDTSLNGQERLKEYVHQIRNPYCYLDDGTVVKISFAETDRTLEDCIRGYLAGL